MSPVLHSIIDSLVHIWFACIGSWMMARSGRFFTDFEDEKAAVNMGVGFLFLVMTAKVCDRHNGLASHAGAQRRTLCRRLL